MRIFTSAGHVNEDGVGLHALNDLPHSQSQQVEEHLADCLTCMDRIRRAKDFSARLRALARAQSKQFRYSF